MSQDNTTITRTKSGYKTTLVTKLILSLAILGATGGFVWAVAPLINSTDGPSLLDTSLSAKTVGSGLIQSSDQKIYCTSKTTDSRCYAKYNKGTNVILTAKALDGLYVFTGWSGACTGTSTTCNLSMSSNKSVTTTFVNVQTIKSLSVERLGTGVGNISSSDGKINCGSTCAATYTVPSGILLPTVTLTAKPNLGSVFTGWSGCPNLVGSTCTLTIDSNKLVTATFTVAKYTLSVSNSVQGGLVVSTPTGIYCGTDCSELYDAGTPITLTIDESMGVFTGWSGACTGTSTVCNLIMDSNKSVTANFDVLGKPPLVRTEVVTELADNSASLMGWANPNSLATSAWFRYSIASGTPDLCNDNFGIKTTVTNINASVTGGLVDYKSYYPVYAYLQGLTPNTTYYYCVIAENKAGKSYGNIYSFKTGNRVLSVVTGAGFGTILSTDQKIYCKSNHPITDSCRATYAPGTQVSFVAQPSSGSDGVIWGWNNTCQNDDACTFTVDQSGTIVYITFPTKIDAKTLGISLLGDGVGTVTDISSPGGVTSGILCSNFGGCYWSYANGSTVTLTASPASGSIFTGWSGACSGTNTNCSVLMSNTDDYIPVIANFIRK